jgi:O-antigen ligase
LFQESLIYKFIAVIAAFLANSWRNSFIAMSVRKTAAGLKAALNGSTIVCFLTRDGYLVRVWEDSTASRLLLRLAKLPELLNPLYKKIEKVYKGSLICRLLDFILDRLHLLTALFLFIAMVTPHTKWNNLYSTAAALLLTVLYIIRVVTTGATRFKKDTVGVYLAIFMVCVLLAEVFSILPKSSLRFLAFYITCFLFMLLIILTVRTKEELSSVLRILLVGITISGLYGIYQYLVGIPVDPSLTDTTLNEVTFGRAYSTFGNPNNFAELLVLFLPFYAAAFVNSKGILRKLIYIVLFIPPVISLLLTLSRSGWIGFAVAIVVFVFFVKKWLIPLIIILALVAFPFLPQPLYRRILTITNPSDTSVITRFQEYDTVMPVLQNFWFTGLGLGNETFTSVVRNYYIHVKGGKLLQHSHNLYLQIWFEVGFVGILSFLAFLVSTFKKSVRALWSSGDKALKSIIAAAMAAICGVLVIGLAEYVWFYPRVMLFFWVVAGILLCAVSLIRAESGSSPAGACEKSDNNDDCQECA